MQKKRHRLNDVLGYLSVDPWIKSVSQLSSSLWWKDWFRTATNWIHFVRTFWDPRISRTGLWKINGIPMQPIKPMEKQLSGDFSAKELDDFSRIPRGFPRISGNFREFPGISENFREFPRISGNCRESSRFSKNPRTFSEDFPVIFRWFSLRKSLQNHPQNLIFGACGAKKCEKMRVFIDMKNDKKIIFYNCGIRSPSKKILPVSRRVLLLNGIPGALRTKQLGNSASQHLSFSALSSSLLREPGRSF